MKDSFQLKEIPLECKGQKAGGRMNEILFGYLTADKIVTESFLESFSYCYVPVLKLLYGWLKSN